MAFDFSTVVMGSVTQQRIRLSVTYAILALIATAANILSQDVVTRVYSGAYALIAALVVGTAVGLVIKYLLDKRYIFRFRARDALHDGQTFVLYTLMGVVTTGIFWGFELTFDHLFQTREMRYLGGVLGLAIGYLAKYQLDKRFVFQRGG